MKRILILTASAFALGACVAPVAPVAPPLCDREAIAWDKVGEPSEFWEICETPAGAVFTPRLSDRDYDDEPRPTGTPTGTPTDGKDTPTDGKDDDDTPTDGKDKPKKDKKPKKAKKPKDDNSDANGKGGNKHDRKDKDKPSQEIAEGKKGV